MPKIKDSEGDQIASVIVKLGENSDWLRYLDDSMSFKAVGAKTHELTAQQVKIRIILED